MGACSGGRKHGVWGACPGRHGFGELESGPDLMGLVPRAVKSLVQRSAASGAERGVPLLCCTLVPVLVLVLPRCALPPQELFCRGTWGGSGSCTCVFAPSRGHCRRAVEGSTGATSYGLRATGPGPRAQWMQTSRMGVDVSARRGSSALVPVQVYLAPPPVLPRVQPFRPTL